MLSKVFRGILGLLAFLVGGKKTEPEGEPEKAGEVPETPSAEKELTEEQAEEIAATWNLLNPP